METNCIIPDKRIEYNGYTYTTYKGETRGTHRIEWIKANGIIPNGYVVGSVERPTVTQVGASTLLISDINVSTYYTQTT